MFSEVLVKMILNKHFSFSRRAITILYGPADVMWFV